MKLHYKGRDGQFDAKAEYENETVCVLAGSFIAKNNSDKLCMAAKNARDKVNEKGILMENISFSSASAAAQFVSGHSTNGLRAWKMENGKPIGTIEKGKAKKPKREA